MVESIRTTNLLVVKLFEQLCCWLRNTLFQKVEKNRHLKTSPPISNKKFDKNYSNFIKDIEVNQWCN